MDKKSTFPFSGEEERSALLLICFIAVVNLDPQVKHTGQALANRGVWRGCRWLFNIF